MGKDSIVVVNKRGVGGRGEPGAALEAGSR